MQTQLIKFKQNDNTTHINSLYENNFEIIYDTIDYVINFFYTFKNKCSVSTIKSKSKYFKILIKQKITFLINDFSFSFKLEEKGIYHILKFLKHPKFISPKNN